ncbi:Neurofilament medium polypeptide [Entamoeba marina]
MSDLQVQSDNHRHSLSDGNVPISTDIDLNCNQPTEILNINDQSVVVVNSTSQQKSSPPLDSNNNSNTVVDEINIISDDLHTNKSNTKELSSNDNTMVNVDHIEDGIKDDGVEVTKKINEEKPKIEKKIIRSRPINEISSGALKPKRSTKDKKNRDLTRSAGIFTKEDIEKHGEGCSLQTVDKTENTIIVNDKDESQTKKSPRNEKIQHDIKKDNEIDQKKDLDSLPKRKEKKHLSKRMFSTLRFNKKDKDSPSTSNETSPRKEKIHSPKKDKDNSPRKEKEQLKSPRKAMSRRDLKHSNDIKHDTEKDDVDSKKHKSKDKTSGTTSDKITSKHVSSSKESKKDLKKETNKELTKDKKNEKKNQTVRTEQKQQSKDEEKQLEQPKKEENKRKTIHESLDPIVEEPPKQEEYKSKSGRRKTISSGIRKAFDTQKTTLVVNDKKEKKTIEVIAEIGYLLQNHIKSIKISSTSTIQQGIEKILVSMKETFDDDIVVYNISGNILPLFDEIEKYSQNNKVHLYVTKRGKRYAKKLTLEIHKEQNEKEIIKDKKTNKLPKIDAQVVYDICRWIYIYGIEIEGLFRISGNQEFVKKKVEKCMDHSTTFLDTMSHGVNDVHNVVGVLKLYLREKTQGLINIQMADAILLQPDQVSELLSVIQKLDIAEKYIVCILLNLIESIIQYKDVNMMGIQNLATIFGPLLVHSSGNVGMTGTHTQLDIAMLFITNCLVIRQELNFDLFFYVDETLFEFDYEENGGSDNFLYDISSLDVEIQKLAEDIEGWMDRMLSGDVEATHWVKVLYEHDSERFTYVVNMLNPTFVLDVMSLLLGSI